MQKIPISQIEISPRQRKELTPEDIKGMALSLKNFGQLQPILLNQKEDGTMELLAGFTRLSGAMMLGWKEIGYTTRDDLSDVEKKEYELEENVRRKNLEWYEEAAAIAEIDAMRRADDPEWGMKKTAELVGKSYTTVQRSVALQKEMDENPEIIQEKTLRSALGKLKTKKQLEERKRAIDLQKAGKGLNLEASILVGDAKDLIREEEPETYDAIVTNFPFGVDLELRGTTKENQPVYQDDEAYITELVKDIIVQGYRVLKDDSWFVAWFDVRKITYSNAAKELFRHLGNSHGQLRRVMGEEWTDKALRLAFNSLGLAGWFEDAGYSYVTLVPSIWAKPNKTQGIIGDPRKGFITAYEAFIFAAKGDAILLKQGKNNLWTFDTPLAVDRVHPLQMPLGLTQEIISLVSMGGGRILDPFAGSGSIGLGAMQNQCEFRGYEINPDLASNGNMLLDEWVVATKK